MSRLQGLLETISAMDESALKGVEFDIQPIPGDQEVIEVTVDGRSELPVYLTMADTQILCICYLFTDDQIKADKRAEMMEDMLEANVPMPLSSFARITDRWAVFGALSVNSSAADLAEEVSTLSDNAVDALEAMADFLK